MIADRDVWQAALLMVKRYGDDATLEAAKRADQLLDEGDVAAAPIRRGGREGNIPGSRFGGKGCRGNLSK